MYKTQASLLGLAALLLTFLVQFSDTFEVLDVSTVHNGQHYVQQTQQQQLHFRRNKRSADTSRGSRHKEEVGEEQAAPKTQQDDEEEVEIEADRQVTYQLPFQTVPAANPSFEAAFQGKQAS